jgi:hypothetical protein
LCIYHTIACGTCSKVSFEVQTPPRVGYFHPRPISDKPSHPRESSTHHQSATPTTNPNGAARSWHRGRTNGATLTPSLSFPTPDRWSLTLSHFQGTSTYLILAACPCRHTTKPGPAPPPTPPSHQRPPHHHRARSRITSPSSPPTTSPPHFPLNISHHLQSQNLSPTNPPHPTSKQKTNPP